jgi:hypothetical protein
MNRDIDLDRSDLYEKDVALSSLTTEQRQRLYAECKRRRDELSVLILNIELNMKKIATYMKFNGESLDGAITSSLYVNY